MAQQHKSMKNSTKEVKSVIRQVARRPARGYRLSYGLLNAIPVGDEIIMYEANARSPLLSLPAEVRNMIWKEFFRGLQFRKHGLTDRWLAFGLDVPYKTIKELLKTCRQIFMEAHNMLYHVAIFDFHPWGMDEFAFGKMREAQVQKITNVQVGIMHRIEKKAVIRLFIATMTDPVAWGRATGVKRIDINLYFYAFWRDYQVLSRYDRSVLRKFAKTHSDVKVTFRGMHQQRTHMFAMTWNRTE